MNRVINNPDMVVEDMLRGILAAHPELQVSADNPRVIRHGAAAERGRVAIVTGGGSGHEPAFIGYVGRHLVDAVAVGEVFSSPTAKSFFDAFKAADGGAGVACLYGNYAGDNMNVKMAIKLAERADIQVKTVVANDDAASAALEERGKRRGVAGEIVMWKVGAARAAQGGTLDQVIAAAQKAMDNTRSIGVGLSACTIPAVGKANFSIKHGDMEVGIGHHGEPGVSVQRVLPARDMARMMVDALLPDLPFVRGDKVSILLSGLGATPLMEQYILYADVADYLNEAGIKASYSFVGNLFTSLEMMGVTLTLTRLDPELDVCLAYPCSSIGLTVGEKT
jgi:dihydroxyacetone kinase